MLLYLQESQMPAVTTTATNNPQKFTEKGSNVRKKAAVRKTAINIKRITTE